MLFTLINSYQEHTKWHLLLLQAYNYLRYELLRMTLCNRLFLNRNSEWWIETKASVCLFKWQFWRMQWSWKGRFLPRFHPYPSQELFQFYSIRKWAHTRTEKNSDQVGNWTHDLRVSTQARREQAVGTEHVQVTAMNMYKYKDYLFCKRWPCSTYIWTDLTDYSVM